MRGLVRPGGGAGGMRQGDDDAAVDLEADADHIGQFAAGAEEAGNRQ